MTRRSPKQTEGETLPYAMPTPDQAEAIARAIVRQALQDLCDARPSEEGREVREEAYAFLTVGLWSPETPRSRLLGLTKRPFLKMLDRHPSLHTFDRLQFRDRAPLAAVNS